LTGRAAVGCVSGLSPKKDALAAEALNEDDAAKSPYTNLLAVGEKDKNDPRLLAFVALYHDAEIERCIQEHFNDVVLTAF
jgi:ABC-type metal ion transport system substrate-binding protein